MTIGLRYSRGGLFPYHLGVRPRIPAPPLLSSGAIVQNDFDLVFAQPVASGYPRPVVSLVSLTRDAVDITADLIGLVLPNFVTGAYVATWQAVNSEGTDTITVSGSFTAPAIAPTFAAGPTLTGTPATGETLTVSYTAAGTAPITAAIRWLKNGAVVSGETGLTYAPGTVASLDTFRAEVSLTNAAGTTGFVASNALIAPDIGEIIGTPVSIAEFADGGVDTLDDVVTWGSFTATVGSIIDPSTKEMQLNGGSWVTYVGSTLTAHPGTWYVRETTTTTAGATRTDVAGPMLVVGEAAAAPAIISHADTVNSNSGATETVVTMPGTYSVGDELVAFVTIDGTGARTVSAGWTTVSDTLVGSTYRRLVLTKTAAGSDTLTIDHGGVGERSTAKTLALTAGSTITEGTVETGSDASAVTYGGAADTLWLIYVSHNGVASDISTGTPPTDYTFLGAVAKSGTTTAADTATHVAYRELNAASENPGAFSLNPSDCRVQTIGVRL